MLWLRAKVYPVIGLLALLCVAAAAQYVGYSNTVYDSNGHYVAYATFRVCTYPATGLTCTPLATTYSSPTGGAQANPGQSDRYGGYSFYAAPGVYTIQLSGPGVVNTTIPYVLLPGPGSTLGYTVVAYSSTPTFNAAQYNTFFMTLTGNVTAPVVANPTVNEYATFNLCQDATGGRTFAWPGSFVNPPTINPTASTCTSVHVYFDGTNWNQIVTGVNGAILSGTTTVDGALKAGAAAAFSGVWPGGTLDPDAIAGATAIYPNGSITLQQAVASLPSGGTIIISPGVYSFSAAIEQGISQPINYVCEGDATLTWNSATAGFGAIAGGSSIAGCHIYSTNPSSTFGVNGGYTEWAANTAFVTANAVTPTVPNARGLFFVASASCTSGASEPSWPTTIGGTVADGSCTWTATGTTTVTIVGNTFDGWGGDEINTGGANYGWIVTRNTFRNGGNEGFLGGGDTQHVVVAYNLFHDLAANAIDFGGGDYNLALGNQISEVGTNAAFGIDRDGIQMAAIVGWSATGNKAVNNTIINAGQNGIRFRGVDNQIADDELAMGNTIVSPGASCIEWDVSATTKSGLVLARDNAVGNHCVSSSLDAYLIASNYADNSSGHLLEGNSATGTNASYDDVSIGFGSSVSQIVVTGNELLSTNPIGGIGGHGLAYIPSGTVFDGNIGASGGIGNLIQGPVTLSAIVGPAVTFSDGGANVTSLVAGSTCGNALYWCIIPPGGKIIAFDGQNGKVIINGADAATTGNLPLVTNSPTETFSPIAANSCANASVTGIAGVTTTMVPTLSPEGGIGEGFVWNAYIPVNGEVGWYVCNVTAGTLTPSAVVWQIRVVQ